MACEFITTDVQSVALNSPVLFTATIPCKKGYVYHEDGSGLLVLRGIVNNPNACFAQYQVSFNGNAALPEGATVTPIAVSIVVSGEPRLSSKAIFTPAAVGDYGNLTSTAIIKVPRGCCFTLAVENVAANTTDTPAPAILIQNGNLTVSRIA